MFCATRSRRWSTVPRPRWLPDNDHCCEYALDYAFKQPIQFRVVGKGALAVPTSSAERLVGRSSVVAVPLLRSWESAVTSCAGANGLVMRMLLGTARDPHSALTMPVI